MNLVHAYMKENKERDAVATISSIGMYSISLKVINDIFILNKQKGTKYN